MKKLSIVIPCYNEEKNIPELMKRINNLKSYSTLIFIIVNNGSTDNTSYELSCYGSYKNIKVVDVPENKGYGYGIIAGLKAADTDFIGWTHADLQTDPKDVILAIDLITKHEEVFVKGKRYGRPILDTFFTIGMSFFETILLKKGLWDINAQPTIFPKKFFDDWEDPPYDFSLDLFAYYFAKNKGLSIHRIPVLFSNRLHGVSHWNFSLISKFKFIKRTISYSIKLKKKLNSL